MDGLQGVIGLQRRFKKDWYRSFSLLQIGRTWRTPKRPDSWVS
jgi:hypothetical protein